MNQNMKRLFILVAATAIIAACGEKIIQTPDTELIPVNLSLGIDTRVTDTAFENGDMVGVYMVNYNGSDAGILATSGNAYDNVKGTYTNKWSFEQQLYWKDNVTKADFYVYYPYANPASISSYMFMTKTDQRVVSDYKTSDFVWGKVAGVAPTKETIGILTNHKLSNMVINVTPGDGFTAESLAAATVSVQVLNVKTNALINLATGEVSATGDSGSVLPYKSGDIYKAVIVPQTIAEGSNLIMVTIDNVNYTLAKGFTFVSGKQHMFTVSVNKSSTGINIGIDGWVTDDIDNGGSAE